MELAGRASCFADAPVEFCFWSLFRVLIQKQNRKRSCYPLFLNSQMHSLIEHFSDHSEKDKKCQLLSLRPDLNDFKMKKKKTHNTKDFWIEWIGSGVLGGRDYYFPIFFFQVRCS